MASSVNISNRSNGKILLRRPNTVFSDSDSDSELSLSLIDARVDSLDDSPQFMGADIPETVSEKTVSKTFESRGISTPDCPVQGPQERHRQVVTKRKKQKKKVDIKYSIPLHFLDFALTVFSTGVFLFDFGMDIVVASEYLNHKRWVPFGFTTGFIVVPAILSNGQSLRWYLIDYADEKEKLKKNPKTRKTPLCVWICRIIFTFPFMMGPVVRHVEYIYHGVKLMTEKSYKEKKHHYKQMLFEDTDAALMRMFEAFLESAPQLVLQLFIVITETHEDPFHKEIVRYAAMLGSWIGLSWSLVSYQRSLRNMQRLKPQNTSVQTKEHAYSHENGPESRKEVDHTLSIPASVINFLWRACEVGPRLVVFALFASQFSYGILIVFAIHWFAMTAWFVCQKTRFYREDDKDRKRDEVVFNIILGYAMVFCFLNARNGNTRYRALVYYIVFYIENYIMFMMWVYWTSSKSEWYYFVTIVVVPAGTLLHIVFQLFYYKACHPKARNIKYCLYPTENYACYQSICHDLVDENEPPAFPLKPDSLSIQEKAKPEHQHVAV